MAADEVGHLLLQAKTLLITTLGVVALIPGPDSRGKLRIRGSLGHVLTYLGILLLLGPWVAIPFLPQPRYRDPTRWFLLAAGIVALAGGGLLYFASLRALLPAFRAHFSEFTPSALVQEGPYAHVRHPIYLSCLLVISGLYLALSVSLSPLFLPLLFAELSVVVQYEEQVILLPGFSSQFLEYRRKVRPCILGLWGGLLAAGCFAALAYLSFLSLADR